MCSWRYLQTAVVSVMETARTWVVYWHVVLYFPSDKILSCLKTHQNAFLYVFKPFLSYLGSPYLPFPLQTDHVPIGVSHSSCATAVCFKTNRICCFYFNSSQKLFAMTSFLKCLKSREEGLTFLRQNFHFAVSF